MAADQPPQLSTPQHEMACSLRALTNSLDDEAHPSNRGVLDGLLALTIPSRPVLFALPSVGRAVESPKLPKAFFMSQ